MKNYQSYIPPHGTTDIRVMSGAERRRAGRIAYACDAERELRFTSSLPGGESLKIAREVLLLAQSTGDRTIWLSASTIKAISP